MIDTWRFGEFFRSWVNLMGFWSLSAVGFDIEAEHRTVLSLLVLRNIKQSFCFY